MVTGVAHIIHAGDIGNRAILDQLDALAPVTAVRGNNDHGAWADHVPERASLTIDGVRLYVLHDVKTLGADEAADARIIVAGHSHRPDVTQRDGILIVNPGSAGPRRFKLPVSVAFVDIADGRAQAHIHMLPL